MSRAEKKRPKVAATTLGQPKTVEANGSPFIAHTRKTCKQGCIPLRHRAGGWQRHSGRCGRMLEALTARFGSLLIQRENREEAA